ncbi:MAG: TIGR04283 family arsenosugar biosynthesis glycosyltransferase [Hormoscilla sp. GM7CHS1pb]|nr:TIGR04283 family arsenosugar biosynthesis glycosyltransferase [Hormoscilla sp. GM7CHS1pb]
MTSESSLIISIIIPVLNEADHILPTLASIGEAKDVEAIVVDGGSVDATVNLVEKFYPTSVKVISAATGRGSQMNAGAAVAKGAILLFLHADTRLPVGFDTIVRDCLRKHHVVAGAFRLQIDGDLAGIRLVEMGVNWRSRLLGLPYGDQGIFMPATVFHDIGGFPNLPIMEDVASIRRLQRLGTIAIAPAAVITSGRRWQKLGILKTTWINQLAIVAYFLGVSPDRIRSWYQSK